MHPALASPTLSPREIRNALPPADQALFDVEWIAALVALSTSYDLRPLEALIAAWDARRAAVDASPAA